MRGNEEIHLANGLKALVDSDKDLESYKNNLALKSDFNLLDAFRFFDITGKGFITRTELADGLAEFGVAATFEEVCLLMRKYDKDGDSLMKYSEFTDMVTPVSLDYAKLITSRIPTYIESDNLDIVFRFDTRKTFATLLDQLIQNEINAEAIRQKLSRRPLFNASDAFEALDKDGRGKLGITEF